MVTGEPVAGGLVFNALLLAYLAPVPLIGLIARRLDVIGWERLKPAAGVLALVLLFAYVTLQTKRVFQGMLMTPESQSLAETYAYSAVWLAFALALFVAGIRLGRQPVRLAGLAVLALVVLKVFVGDMSNLEGLLRIASFVGLGLCLVGIGWLYQRFVRRTRHKENIMGKTIGLTGALESLLRRPCLPRTGDPEGTARRNRDASAARAPCRSGRSRAPSWASSSSSWARAG